MAASPVGSQRLSARSVTRNPTILSGDLNQDGQGPGDANHVVTATSVSATAVLDGFTVTGGVAFTSSGTLEDGAGIYISSSSPTIANCTITGNSAIEDGGGIYVADVASGSGLGPSITHTTIHDNEARRGAGMYIGDYNVVTITESTLSANVIKLAGATSGGGIFAERGSNVTILRSTISGNSATVKRGRCRPHTVAR